MDIIDLRGELKSHPSKKYNKRQLKDIKKIAVHHSLTKDIPGNRDVFAFANYHVNELGWPAIGYHYVIDNNGTIYKCNNTSTITHHVGKHNWSALGVCLVGDFRDDNPTPEQYKSLCSLLERIILVCGLTTEDVLGHSEFEGYEWKQCPCFNVNSVRRTLNERMFAND